MRNTKLFALALLGLSACSTTSSTTRSSPERVGPDGLSCATRVVVPSIPAEYEWVKRNYPGAKVEMQALGNCDGAPADELHVRTAQGQKLTLYFDISSFFGKGF